jgi:signal transduction histidine kinase
MVLAKVSINLNDLMGQMFDDFQMFHPEIYFEKALKKTLFIHADSDLFLQLMMNLMNNAVKYNINPGHVLFRADTTAHSVVFTLSNTTDLNATGLDERVFERFYRHRVKESHLQVSEVAGSGLGLSLCREIVRAHRGELVLLPRDGNMITFKCTFPVC